MSIPDFSFSNPRSVWKWVCEGNDFLSEIQKSWWGWMSHREVVHLRGAILYSQPPQPLGKSPKLMLWLRNCVCHFLGMVEMSVGDDTHAGSQEVFGAVIVDKVC